MKNSIYANDSRFQVQDVLTMAGNGKSFTSLLRKIASEYGEYKDGEYSVNLKSLDITSKRLILYYVLDQDDYEFAMSSELRTNLMFDENIEYIDDHMSDAANDVYVDAMEEMGMSRGRYSDNGETYWYRS